MKLAFLFLPLFSFPCHRIFFLFSAHTLLLGKLSSVLVFQASLLIRKVVLASLILGEWKFLCESTLIAVQSHITESFFFFFQPRRRWKFKSKQKALVFVPLLPLTCFHFLLSFSLPLLSPGPPQFCIYRPRLCKGSNKVKPSFYKVTSKSFPSPFSFDAISSFVKSLALILTYSKSRAIFSSSYKVFNPSRGLKCSAS